MGKSITLLANTLAKSFIHKVFPEFVTRNAFSKLLINGKIKHIAAIKAVAQQLTKSHKLLKIMHLNFYAAVYNLQNLY